MDVRDSLFLFLRQINSEVSSSEIIKKLTTIFRTTNVTVVDTPLVLPHQAPIRSGMEPATHLYQRLARTKMELKVQLKA